MVIMVDSFILKFWATAAADPNLWYISSNQTFSCNVLTFLCFLGVLPTLLVAIHVGPMVLFKVYAIALKAMKNTREQGEITPICKLPEGQTPNAEMISITCGLSRYSQHLILPQ